MTIWADSDSICVGDPFLLEEFKWTPQKRTLGAKILLEIIPVIVSVSFFSILIFHDFSLDQSHRSVFYTN